MQLNGLKTWTKKRIVGILVQQLVQTFKQMESKDS